MYYQIEKEQRINTIKIITQNNKDILNKLTEIENRVGICKTLPFYDEIIELINMGQNVEAEDLDKYYKLYSETFRFASIRLSEVFRCLAYNFKNQKVKKG